MHLGSGSHVIRVSVDSLLELSERQSDISSSIVKTAGPGVSEVNCWPRLNQLFL